MPRRYRWSSLLGMGALLLIIGFLMLYPALMLVFGSVWSTSPGIDGEFTWEGFRATYGSATTYEVWWNSVALSAEMTVASMVLAVFFAWTATRTNTPGRRAIFPIMVAIMALPPLFFAMSWALLGNPRVGLLNHLATTTFSLSEPPFNIYSWFGLLFVLVLSATAFNFLLCYGFFRAMDRSLEEASLMSGAGRLRSFFFVEIPVLAPGLLGVAILSFVRGLQFFDTPLLLGTPADIHVFSTQMFDYIQNHVPARYTEASALALLMLVTLVVLVVLQWRILGRRQFVTITGKGYRRESWDIGRWRWFGTGVIVLFTLLALGLPLVQLVLGSLQSVYGVYSGELSLDNYRAAFDRPVVRDGLRNTVVVAILGGLLGTVLSGLIAYVTLRSKAPGRRLLELMTWIPWAMPGIVLALGMMWAYLSVPWLTGLYGTPWLLLLALIVGVVPLCTRLMSGAIRQVDSELEDSGRVHGAPWWRVFVGVLLRLIAPSFLSSWVVAAIFITGELSIPVLLYTPGSELISVAIFSLFEDGRSAEAAAVFVVLMAVISASLLLALACRSLGTRLLKGNRPAKPSLSSGATETTENIAPVTTSDRMTG